MAEAAVGHTPVLLEEVIEILAVRPSGVYVDATVGGGGHSVAIQRILGTEGCLIGLDRDAMALSLARERLKGAQPRIMLVQANFRFLQRVLSQMEVSGVDGVLFDLGVSSPQVDRAERGFSYWQDGPLDMRMDSSQPIRAYDLVNQLPENDLAELIARYGEERWASRIAAAVAVRRLQRPIQTTTELAAIVKNAVPAAARRHGPHPARRTFQALRIAVNQELDSLREGLEQACQVLRSGGRLVVISFHSLEDRIVKQFFASKSGVCNCPKDLPVCVCGCEAELRVITRRPVRPRKSEIDRNPRSRSARLRASEKLSSSKQGSE